MIKRIINWIIKNIIEDDEYLLEEYKFDVVGCHPPNIGDNIQTFEEWKEARLR